MFGDGAMLMSTSVLNQFAVEWSCTWFDIGVSQWSAAELPPPEELLWSQSVLVLSVVVSVAMTVSASCPLGVGSLGCVSWVVDVSVDW